MGKWLAKFSAHPQDSRPDKPDTLDRVSGMSGPDSKGHGETPSHPTTEICDGCGRLCAWEGQDGTIHVGRSVLLGRTREEDGRERFWVGIERENGLFVWVQESQIRSRDDYERQRRARG
jgi:hypothetical protein